MAKKKQESMEELLWSLGEIDLSESSVDKAMKEDIASSLKGIEGLSEFLRATMSEDIKRHFSAASPVEQMAIKGAFMRTRYLLKLIQEASTKKPSTTKPATMTSSRYAS